MFTKLYSMFSSVYNMFSLDYCRKHRNLPPKNIYIQREIDKYKQELYFTNTYLSYIPPKKIMDKREELSKQYDNMIKNKF